MPTVEIIPDSTRIKFEIATEYIGKKVEFTVCVVEDNKRTLIDVKNIDVKKK